MAAFAAAAGGLQAVPAIADGPSLAELQLDQALEGAPRSNPHWLVRAQDLAPYFDTPSLKAAKQQFDQGRFRRARQLLASGGGTPQVRFLSALAAYDQDDFATAAAEFAGLAGDYPALADQCELYAGKAFERLGKRADAVAHYSKVRDGSSAFGDARFGMAHVLFKRGDLEGAIDALSPLRERAGVKVKMRTWAKGDALLDIADLAQRKGDPNAAHRALLEAWATSPFSAQADVAWKRLQGLPVPNKWRIRRAEALLDLHFNLEAARLAKQVKAPLPDEWACRAGLVAGNALRKERQHRQAIAALTPVAKACPAVRMQALLTMAYSQSVVDPEAGVATYDAVAVEFPGQRYARDAAYLAAQIVIRRGNLPAALARLEAISRQDPPDEYVPEALFQQALLRRELGQKPQAAADLARLVALPQTSPEQAQRAQYWRARLLEDLEDPGAAAAMAKVAAEHPASYYGLLARSRLGANVAASPQASGATAVATATATAGAASTPKRCGEADKWPLDAGPLAADPTFVEGVELLRLDLPGAAPPLLAIDPRPLPASAAELLIEVLRRAGADRAVGRVTRLTLGRDLDGPIDDCAADTWQALYPRPFLPAIKKAAAAARLEPELLLALVREESRFNPYARSSTGALGLTQLMLDTAQEVARDFKLGEVRADDLFRPSTNVAVGGRYLGTLVAQFKPSLGQAVAAYNAGPSAVARWDRPRKDAELDEWVEWIPVDETRDYVKRVLGSYGVYRLLYRTDPAPVVALRIQ
ncbi:MAG TPA: transglycosylase SLT domain-containing protein [Myxococcaceae bacterium]|nr:transglycosylase SLT domain-containing protein [Myxococcaceae bacterium]